MRIRLDQLTVAVVLAAACGRQATPAGDSTAAATVAAATAPAVDTTLPKGELGASILRGKAILLATRDSLPGHVGNSLRCTSCHLDEGRRANSMPWTGVYARFPQYRSRTGSVIRLEDRINDCLQRSLDGKALAWDDPAMRDMVAYMSFLSRGIDVGATVPGQGLPKIEATSGDTVAGLAIYAAQCARCHGADGEGTAIAPPTWGPESFNIGAGMARLRTAAAFIQHNMPFDKATTLTEQQAVDVAAYVVSRPRPDFARKADDWPKGDPPPDVAYPTTAGRRAGAGSR
jgi:thiosulfate dehydrogenase